MSLELLLLFSVVLKRKQAAGRKLVYKNVSSSKGG
jgi:hypothetical protein